MAGIPIASVNLVVDDGAAASAFLLDLGVDMPPLAEGWQDWGPHHRGVPTATQVEVELDSAAFARHWGDVEAPAPTAVVNLGAPDRASVDRLHAQALELGARTRKEPHDAFWGSRFALVEAPGPLLVGLLSPRDDAHRGDPPDVADLV